MINPVDRKGKVESMAKRFKLSHKVLVGRDSDIIKKYKLAKMPGLVIVDKYGKIVFYKEFATADTIACLLRFHKDG